jgi:nucleoside-diphosphate-sugar epimerase
MKNKATIFLIGGGGFIGKHFREMASNRGFRVFVLSRNNPKLLINEVLITGSFGQLNSLNFPDKEIDYVVNLAGEKRNEKLMQKVNVDALAELIDFTSGLRKARLIHLSSAGIYGIAQHPETKITEQSAIYPSNLYEKTKHEGDLLIDKLASENNLDFFILRPTNVFGIDEPSLKLLNLMRSIKMGRFFMIDPNAMVNYIGVNSVCKSIFDAFTFEGKVRIYNINAPCSISNFSKIIVDATQTENKIIKTIPSAFKFIFKIMCNIADFLPKKYQKINSAKYRELTDHRFIDSNLFFNQTERNPYTELKEDLTLLSKWYQNRKML